MITGHQHACVIFNRLNVNVVENTSGIFIGTNRAVGWSNYSKSNQGFGSAYDSEVVGAVNVIYDQDLIDAPMRDAKIITSPAADNLGQQCDVSFQSVNALSLYNSSTISVGDNKQNAWSGFHKNNFGNGKGYGINRLKQISNLIVDNDVVDAPSWLDTKIKDIVIG